MYKYFERKDILGRGKKTKTKYNPACSKSRDILGVFYRNRKA